MDANADDINRDIQIAQERETRHVKATERLKSELNNEVANKMLTAASVGKRTLFKKLKAKTTMKFRNQRKKLIEQELLRRNTMQTSVSLNVDQDSAPTDKAERMIKMISGEFIKVVNETSKIKQSKSEADISQQQLEDDDGGEDESEQNVGRYTIQYTSKFGD